MARSVVAEVEEEFGMPFWDVVRGFAEDNYGCDTTARILGYTKPGSFRELIARHNKKIDWPAQGSCNAQKDRGPYSKERTENALHARMNHEGCKAMQYQSRTGETVLELIERIRKTHTITEVAHIIGYCESSPLRSWLNVRGLKIEFKKKTNLPPKGMGWQSEECRAIGNRDYAIYLERKAREQSPAIRESAHP